MLRRLATSASLLQSCIQREEAAAASAGARFSPTRRMRTAAVMERLEESLVTAAGDGERSPDEEATNDEDEEGKPSKRCKVYGTMCQSRFSFSSYKLEEIEVYRLKIKLDGAFASEEFAREAQSSLRWCAPSRAITF